ncbi:Gfo/Idh/MocA family protein [Neobacillus vireti]|uniref:Gfo/Idh/MocA family protein n=1 Tax=Neobacillus vireti TaxID=220686 RepID=UPI002FFE2581
MRNFQGRIIDRLLFQYFMGEVESAYAHTAILAHEGIGVEDVAEATVKFKDGRLGTIVGTTAGYIDGDEKESIRIA